MKHVAICFCGQLRSNILNPSYDGPDKTLSSFFKYICNEEFKKRYTFHVYFCTDDIDIQKAKNIFGDNLYNIHIPEKNNWYLKEVPPIVDYDVLLKRAESVDTKGYNTYLYCLYQLYRQYSVYNMITHSGVKYDYVIKLRPDMEFFQDVGPLLNILDTTDVQVIMEHDHLVFMKIEHLEILKLIEVYGRYTHPIEPRKDIYFHYSRDRILAPEYGMMFCQEKQMLDHIHYILTSKGYNFHSSFLGITYPSYYLLYRKEGDYSCIDKSHPVYRGIWIPFDDLKTITRNLSIKF